MITASVLPRNVNAVAATSRSALALLGIRSVLVGLHGKRVGAVANAEMAVATHGLEMGGEGLRQGSAARDAIVLAPALTRPKRALHGDGRVWKHIGLLQPIDDTIDHGPTLVVVDRAVGLVLGGEGQSEKQHGERVCPAPGECS